MKKTRAITLILVLLLSISLLAGCGGGNDNKPSATPASTGESSTSTPTETPAAKGDTMDDAISKYSLDVTSDDWQDMSSERLSEEDLLVAYETIKAKSAYSIKYEDVVGIVEVEPSSFRFDGEQRIFEWQTEESTAKYIRFIFVEKDGDWVYYMFSKTNM